MFVCFLKIKEATVPGRPESRRTRAALSGLFQDQSGAADKAVRLLPLICRRSADGQVFCSWRDGVCGPEADAYSRDAESIQTVGCFQSAGVNDGLCVCRANPWGRRTPGRSSASCPSTEPPPCSRLRPPSEPSASRTPTPPSGESTPCPGKRKPGPDRRSSELRAQS